MSELLDEQSRRIRTLIKKKIATILEIWTRTFGKEICLEMEKLYEHSNNFFDEVIKESLEKEDEIKTEVEELKNAASDLIQLLKVQENLPSTVEEVPLIVVKTELEKMLVKLHERLRRRKQQVSVLLLEQEALGAELDIELRPLSVDPLATEDEITNFLQHLDELKQLRVARLKEMEQMRTEIKNYQLVLELPIEAPETEGCLLNQQKSELNKESFTNLKKMHQSYSRQVKYKQILELYAQRKTFCNSLIELDMKSSDPGRYNNRGGQLLKEARNRRMLATALTKIEQQLNQLVKQYEQEEKTFFDIQGENIRELMAKDWPIKNKNQAKSNQSSPVGATSLGLPKTGLEENCVELPGNKKRNLSFSESSSPKLFLKSTNTVNRRSLSKPPLAAKNNGYTAKKQRINNDNIKENSANITANSYFGNVVPALKTNLTTAKLSKSNLRR